MGKVKAWLEEQIKTEAERLKKEHPEWDDEDVWSHARDNVCQPPKGEREP